MIAALACIAKSFLKGIRPNLITSLLAGIRKVTIII